MESAVEESRLPLIMTLLREFVAEELGSERHICSVYGSYAKGVATLASDIDILIACADASSPRLHRAITFTIDLHQRFGLPLDEEIPFDRKLVIPFTTLELACSGIGFRDQSGAWHIGEISKEPAFLASRELQLRFLPAMLISQHLFVSGDHEYFVQLRHQALDMLTEVICNVRFPHPVGISEIVAGFMEYCGRTGDFHFGFDSSRDREYLVNLLTDRETRRLNLHGQPS